MVGNRHQPDPNPAHELAREEMTTQQVKKKFNPNLKLPGPLRVKLESQLEFAHTIGIVRAPPSWHGQSLMSP